MILGTGIDIIQISRIEKIIAKYSDHRLAKRILSEEELKRLDSLSRDKQPAFIAKRFVAKEAFSKAIGTGIRGKLRFNYINIYNDKYGKPKLEITPVIKAILHENFFLSGRINLFPEKPNILEQININISIADDYPVAISVVIISVINSPFAIIRH